MDLYSVKQKLTGRMARIIFGTLVSGAGVILLSLAISGFIKVPQSIQIGPFGVRLYSMTLIVAVLVGIAIFEYLKSKEKDLKDVDVWDGVMYAIIPAILGARVYHVLTDWYLYQDNPWAIFEIWNGGIGFIGGMIGGAIGVLIFLRIKKINAAKVFAMLTIVVPVAQAVGRLGNFFNKELFGLPTDLPWGLYIPPHQNPFIFLRSYSFFHPLFLYEAVLNLLLALFLYKMWRNRVSYSTMLITYVTGYGVIRYTLDFLRFDGRSGFMYLSYAQWIVLAWLVFVVVFGICYQIWHKYKYGVWFTNKKHTQK